MFLHKTNFLLKSLFPPEAVWRIPGLQKTVYLTFDDGPIPEVTEWVLEVLKKYNARATFFCIGDNIYKHPQVFEQVKNAGNIIGNHTFNHLNGWRTKADTYFQNTALCQDQIKESLRLFRPPYGRITGKQAGLLQKEGYQIVMWDVLSGDFERSVSPETCLRKSIGYTENGSVIVFHDSIKAEKNLRYTLPRYLDFLRENDYQFDVL